MSDNVRPEQATLATLARLVRHLGDELASYRKRALSAETRLKIVDEQAAAGGVSPERSIELENENEELKQRLEEAKRRTTKLLERVRFLRQQHDQAETP